MRVLQFDHKANYLRDKAAIDAAVQRVLLEGGPIMGPDVARFEEAFAQLVGSSYAIGVMSGTAALTLAVASLGIRSGDEVITVANSDTPTSHAISLAGATPVWVDIDPDTYNILPGAIVDAITSRTRAILPVHLYGVPVDMDVITAVARDHELAVIEDAALATGALYKGRAAGSLGDVAAFSTAPAKVLGGICSGGVVTTSSVKIFEAISELRHYGRSASPYPDSNPVSAPMPGPTRRIGYNERINTIDAAALLIRMRRLQGDLLKRRENADRYRELLAGTGLKMQRPPIDCAPAWRVFTIRVPDRDRVYKELRSAGYGVSLMYLPPIHLDECYKDLGYPPGSLPNTERFCDELLCLPCHQFVTSEQVEEVAAAVKGLVA